MPCLPRSPGPVKQTAGANERRPNECSVERAQDRVLVLPLCDLSPFIVVLCLYLAILGLAWVNQTEVHDASMF